MSVNSNCVPLGGSSLCAPLSSGMSLDLAGLSRQYGRQINSVSDWENALQSSISTQSWNQWTGCSASQSVQFALSYACLMDIVGVSGQCNQRSPAQAPICSGVCQAYGGSMMNMLNDQNTCQNQNSQNFANIQNAAMSGINQCLQLAQSTAGSQQQNCAAGVVLDQNTCGFGGDVNQAGAYCQAVQNNDPCCRAVTGNRPNQQNQPNQPNQPNQQNQPNQPNQPNLPNQPNQPNQPNPLMDPNQPNQQNQPINPNEPVLNRPGPSPSNSVSAGKPAGTSGPAPPNPFAANSVSSKAAESQPNFGDLQKLMTTYDVANMNGKQEVGSSSGTQTESPNQAGMSDALKYSLISIGSVAFVAIAGFALFATAVHFRKRSRGFKAVSEPLSAHSAAIESPTSETPFKIVAGDDRKFRVISEYTPELPDEISLAIGDVVAVQDSFDDGWCLCRNVTSGAEGLCPFACLELIQ